jgi:hypothetical protein
MINFKNSIIVFVISLLMSMPFLGTSQSIVAKSFVKNRQVFLRFVATSPAVWDEIKNKGFTIERIEMDKLSDSTDLSRLPITKLTPVPLKPLEKENETWKTIVTSTDYGAFIYKGLYGLPNAKDEKSKHSAAMIWSMLMKQADLNVESAKLLGLYFKDTDIKLNKIYVYQISVIEKVGASKHQLKLIVDPKKENELPVIKLTVSEVKRKTVSLTFSAKPNEAYYSGFLIERSTDSSSQFKTVTAKPLIFIVGEHEKNKTNITHQDTLPDDKIVYYYRLRGINYFGEYGAYSPIIKAKGQETIGSYPFMDSVKLVRKETQLKVYFHFPKGSKLSVIKGLAITRSDKSGELGTLLNPVLLPANSTNFLDEKPHQTNYYKVIAITNDGDSVPSFEGFGMLPDREPPTVPTDITGFIDSAGLVHLNWKINTEKDLQGYRIFRKNDLNEELIERTRRIVLTNSYTDTVNIKTLTKYIYYSLTAVDNVFNNSTYSPVIKLKRPDIISPVPPLFVKTVHNNKHIELKWYNSTSDDVERYELLRIQHGTMQTEKIKEWLVADTTSFYSDTTATLGETYNYKLMVYDDSKNKSESLSPFITFETGLRKPITTITQSVDIEKRTIELAWTYPEKNIYNFIIYKAKQGEDFRIFKTLKPSEFKIVDKQITPGNVYQYRIKATYTSGVESELSKEIKIVF